MVALAWIGPGPPTASSAAASAAEAEAHAAAAAASARAVVDAVRAQLRLNSSPTASGAAESAQLGQCFMTELDMT